MELEDIQRMFLSIFVLCLPRGKWFWFLCCDRLKLFSDDGVVDYRDSRDIDSLIQFVTSHAPSPNVSSWLHPLLLSVPIYGWVCLYSQDVGGTDMDVQMDDNGLAHLTDDNFEPYLTARGGVHFVKFYAPW